MDDKYIVNWWPALLAVSKVEHCIGQMDRPVGSIDRFRSYMQYMAPGKINDRL